MSEEIPKYVIQKADEIVSMFGTYKGPQAGYLMEDLVALAAGDTNQMSRMCDLSLEQIAREHYKSWTQTDFQHLLVKVGDGSDYLKELIESEQKYRAEDD